MGSYKPTLNMRAILVLLLATCLLVERQEDLEKITTKNRKAKPIQRKEEECPNMETREKEFGTLLLQRRSVEMPVQLCIRVMISHMIYAVR